MYIITHCTAHIMGKFCRKMTVQVNLSGDFVSKNHLQAPGFEPTTFRVTSLLARRVFWRLILKFRCPQLKKEISLATFNIRRRRRRRPNLLSELPASQKCLLITLGLSVTPRDANSASPLTDATGRRRCWRYLLQPVANSNNKTGDGW